jgi:membrane-bound serine protease (ClpP class)
MSRRGARLALAALVLLAAVGAKKQRREAALDGENPQAALPAPTARADDESNPEAPRSAGPGRVLLLDIDGDINPATADYVHEGIQAGRDGAFRAVLIQLDTPGGLLDSTKEIIKDILGAPLPVVVYVAPAGAGATSAGVFVTMAGHIAAMAPGTNIGAAHPVGGQGENIGGDMREKVENFTVSLSRTIAQQRGRNVEWAEKAVRESVSITEREAVEQKVVDLIATDVADLLAKIDARRVEVNGQSVVLATAGAVIERHPMRLRQKILDIIANPNVSYLFMMAGMLGLYVEFTNPGLVFPGVAGAICMLLALSAFQVLPINYTGLGLLLFGMVLLIAEVFLPTFGALGVGGIVSFVLGSLLLFDTPDSTLAVDRTLIGATAAALGAVVLLLGFLVVRTQRRRSTSGAEGMIGEVGEVRRAEPAGGKVKVFVHGEYWDASAEGPLAVGDAVEVVAVDGMRMRVRRRP